jgi:hypothetical protein
LTKPPTYDIIIIVNKREERKMEQIVKQLENIIQEQVKVQTKDQIEKIQSLEDEIGYLKHAIKTLILVSHFDIDQAYMDWDDELDKCLEVDAMNGLMNLSKQSFEARRIRNDLGLIIKVVNEGVNENEMF